MAPRPQRTRLRHALGFALAPLVAPLLDVAIEVARFGWPRPHVRCAFGDGPFLALAVTGPLAYAVALVVGVPLVLSLRAFRRLTVTWLVPTSALAGALVATAMPFVSGIPCVGETDCRLWPFPALGAVLAAAVSGTYCAIAGVPPRRAAPPPDPTSRASP